VRVAVDTHQVSNAMFKRFQELIAATASVRFANSDSLNSLRAASYTTSDTSPSLSAVTASVHASAPHSRVEYSGHSRHTFNM